MSPQKKYYLHYITKNIKNRQTQSVRRKYA